MNRQLAVGLSEDTMSNFSVALVTVACHRHGVELIDGSIYLLTLRVSCMTVTLFFSLCCRLFIPSTNRVYDILSSNGSIWRASTT